jgi:hypothetical protein
VSSAASGLMGLQGACERCHSLYCEGDCGIPDGFTRARRHTELLATSSSSDDDADESPVAEHSGDTTDTDESVDSTDGWQ